MTYIIAEIGANHNGSMDLAKEHIDSAATCGADAVKFQSWTPESLWAKEYLEDHPKLWEEAKQYSLSIKQLRELADYTRKVTSCDFICSVFSPEEVDALADILDYIKIASGDITNERLLRRVAQTRKPVILSTGMASMNEVGQAVRWLYPAHITLLHCVSYYPPQYDKLHLRRMDNFRWHTDRVGLSDHTPGFEIPLAAIALGADMLEKHFTLDRNMEGWDHKISADPETMSIICEGRDKIVQALRPAHDIPDKDQRQHMRRSAVTARALQKGHILQEEDIIYRRPGTGLMNVVGYALAEDVSEGRVIHEWMLENAG